MTTSRFESGLCPTRNRPNQVGWTFSWPTTNWLEGRVELVDSLLEGGWVSVRRNLAENSANSAKIRQIWLKPDCVFNEILSDLVSSNWWIPQTVEIEGLLVIESIGSVEIGFRFKDPPTDPPKLSLGLQEPPPTRHRSRIRRFPDQVGWYGRVGLVHRWSGQPYLKLTRTILGSSINLLLILKTERCNISFPCIVSVY